MSVRGRTWQLTIDPSSTGFAANVGEYAENTLTGIKYIKTGAADTAWTVDTSAYSGGAGPPGPTGSPGVVPFGQDGEPGEDGISIPGTTGATGSPGAQGVPGLSIVGQDGEAGDDGISIVGPTGATGAPGPSTIGIDGEPGEDGFSIPGAPGAQGIPGAPGLAFGQDGEPGEDGWIGPPGTTGAVGATGLPGPAGGVTIGTALVQFATAPRRSGRFVIEPPGGFTAAQVGKPVIIQRAPGAPSFDEAELESQMTFAAMIVSQRRMNVFWAARTPTGGRTQVNYLIGA